MLYYPNIDLDDLWGFHGTNDPKVRDFVNKHHEDRPIVNQNGELIIYPKESSELPSSENQDPSQLLAINNLDPADNIFGTADNTLGEVDNTLGLAESNLALADSNLALADSTFGAVDNTLAPADDTFSTAENLFDPVEANDASMNLFLDDFS